MKSILVNLLLPRPRPPLVALILMDPEATNSYIDSELVQERSLPTTKLDMPIDVTNFDGKTSRSGLVRYKCRTAINLQRHRIPKMDFLVLPLPDTFSEDDIKIDLLPDSTPPFGGIYQLATSEQEILKEYIDDMLAKGLIRESSRAAASPVLFVPKAGGELRLCVDFRHLNLISIKDQYPIPSTDMLLNQPSCAKIYTKLDLRSAYHRVRVAKGHKWKTAFRTRYGLCEYLVMPFGLTNAPGVFQQLVNKVLRKFIDRLVIVYLNDILIYPDNLEEHDKHVWLVLEELRVNKLYAKPEKCEFDTNIVEYLGFKVTPGGVTSNPVKIERVVKWTAPHLVKQLQGFLGFCNFYRTFVRNFSKVVSPLNHLLKKNVQWEWSRDCDDAFELLKAKFTSHPVLRHFQPERPTRVELDASNIGIAAVLMQQQEHNKQYHPVAFVSRTLSPPERNYKVHDREMLAI